MIPHTLFGDPEQAVPEQAPSHFADVVFDRPLDHSYTYGVPDHLAPLLTVGKRVLARFGKGGKPIPGFCVRVGEQPPERDKVKWIESVLDEEALVDENVMKLTRWMADYYLCGWGQVLQAVVPAGVRENAGTRRAVFVAHVEIENLPDPLPTVSPQQKAVIECLRVAGHPIELGELSKRAGCGSGVIGGLVKKGILRKFHERVESVGHGELNADEAETESDAHELHSDQIRVWDTVSKALAEGGYHPFLLHGVTGSGKTEIYLRAIEEVVKRGQEAIVLVPEISLTPQTIGRFQGRCGELAVMHSHLTDADRGGYWRRIAAGKIQVVVGARSAIFAPTRKLGLIVIDEEHENSFKQESTPRYHARDVAVMRARLENIPIIMGSATPSLESWANAARGTYTLLTMPARVESRPLPPVRVIDLRHEPKTKGRNFAIGPTLTEAMSAALKNRGQVILLLNRRGFSTHVHCPGCGYVAQCRNCDLALTFHRTKAALVCHYCGWENAPYQQCPACAKSAIQYQGLGTEKLQAEIAEKFPGFVCERMDSDTMIRPGSHRRVLEAFRDGLIHILAGTQMIAKGLDFPNVTLVGVVNADVGLHLPDFRSAERTFQLLAQVAGRTGRGEKGGMVMVQTFTPDHPCIVLAAKHAYEEFARMELAHRHEHRYPPYERLARLIVRSQVEEAAAKFTTELAGVFKEAIATVIETKKAQRQSVTVPTVRLLGPVECPVFRLKNFYRFHFQLQSENSAVLHEVIRHVLTEAKPPGGVEFQVDIDPYSML